jgi:hypothetical protein
MAINKREKNMLAVAGILGLGVVVIYFLTGGATSSAELNKTLEKKQADLQKAKSEALRPGDLQVRLSEMKKHSLPWTQSKATSNYQNWLRDITSYYNIKEVTFSPGSAATINGADKKAIYTEQTYRLKMKCNLNQLVSFLNAFHSVGYLHKIKDLKITPVADSVQLDVNLTINTLLLPGADGKGTDGKGPEFTAPERKLLLALDDRTKDEDYTRNIVRSDIFGNYVPPRDPSTGPTGPVVQTQTRVRTPTPTLDQLKLTLVKAIVVPKTGIPEVWIHLVTTNEMFHVTEGKEFRSTNVPAIRGEVVKINQGDVVLKVANKNMKVLLGCDLGTGYPIKDETEVVQTASATGTEAAPATEGAPVAEGTPVAEGAPAAEAAPADKAAPAAEGATATEAAPATETAPAAEAAKTAPAAASAPAEKTPPAAEAVSAPEKEKTLVTKADGAPPADQAKK